MVSCNRCGRTLTNLISISARMGPICRGKTTIAELREEAQSLAKSEPENLPVEIEMYKVMSKYDVSISGSMESTFAKKEKDWQRGGWIFVRDFSIHFPERLEYTLKEYHSTHLFNAVVYDTVNNGKSRLVVNLWRWPHKKGLPENPKSIVKARKLNNPKPSLLSFFTSLKEEN